MDIQQVLGQVDLLIKALEAFRTSLSQAEPTLPSNAQEKADSGICLICGVSLQKHPTKDQAWTGKIVRGNHASCFRALIREMDAGTLTDSQAISKGLLLPRKAGGRDPEKNPLRHRIREVLDEAAVPSVPKKKPKSKE